VFRRNLNFTTSEEKRTVGSHRGREREVNRREVCGIVCRNKFGDNKRRDDSIKREFSSFERENLLIRRNFLHDIF